MAGRQRVLGMSSPVLTPEQVQAILGDPVASQRWLLSGELPGEPAAAAPARDRQLGPLPFPSGPAPAAALIPSYRPPLPADGFWRAQETIRGWLMPCPACTRGWCGILPDGTGEAYRIAAELTCTWGDGCDPYEIEAFFLWRQGLMPPAPAPDESARAYWFTAIKRELAAFQAKPSTPALQRTAKRLGQLAAAAGLDRHGAAKALWVAAGRPDEAAFRAVIAPSLVAGFASPARKPEWPTA
jgi:hypothetical protein